MLNPKPKVVNSEPRPCWDTQKKMESLNPESQSPKLGFQAEVPNPEFANVGSDS